MKAVSDDVGEGIPLLGLKGSRATLREECAVERDAWTKMIRRNITVMEDFKQYQLACEIPIA
jgi:hypothetical protein